MTTESPSLRFIAAGDLHTGEIPPERLATIFEAAARVPEARFFAVPGDLTNAGLPEQYTDLQAHIERLPLPFYGTMGNHDVHTGPDEAARERFTRVLGVEAPSYRIDPFGVPFLFLSTDGNLDGVRVEINRSLDLLEATLSAGSGPAFVFCHAPLTGTVQGAPGRVCFTSDEVWFGLPQSEAVRALVRRSGRPVVWICGHTHTPVEAETMVTTERLDEAVLHSVNVSSPYYTGRDVDRAAPILLFHFALEDSTLRVRIEDVERREIVRAEDLPLA